MQPIAIARPSICFALAGLLLCTVACKKNSNEIMPGGDSSPAFVGPRWQMNAFLLDPAADFDGDGTVDSDLLPFMPACERDNSLTFDKNGTVSTSEGSLSCSDEDPAPGTKSDAWRYDEATRTLRITDGEDASVTTWKVVESSAKALRIQTTLQEEGHTFSATIVWKAI